MGKRWDAGAGTAAAPAPGGSSEPTVESTLANQRPTFDHSNADFSVSALTNPRLGITLSTEKRFQRGDGCSCRASATGVACIVGKETANECSELSDMVASFWLLGGVWTLESDRRR